MKTLDVQARLEYARAGVAVLRALKLADRTMRYGEFARAIGLIPDGEIWQAWHRKQISEKWVSASLTQSLQIVVCLPPS